MASTFCLGAYRDTLALMRQVGADPETLLDRRPLQIIDKQRLSPGPADLACPHSTWAWGLLTAQGAGFGDKLKTAWWMQCVKARRFLLKGRLHGQ
jgi:hypothetical protein